MDRVQHEPDEEHVIDAEKPELEGAHSRSFEYASIIVIFICVVSGPLVWRIGGPTAFAIEAALASVVWLALVTRPPGRDRPLRFVLLVAMVLRIPLWLSPPDLSGDVWRYLWDGTVSLSGVSPYSAPPDHPSLIDLRQEWHDQINHPEIPTIYPPYAQLVFLIPALAGGSLLVWRLVLLLFEVVALRLLHRHSPFCAMSWALFPLAIWEGHWSAHVDLAAAAMILAAVLLAGSPIMSGGALGIAAGIKLIPLIALPAFLARSTGRRKLVSAFMVTAALAIVPFLGGAFMPGARDYGERWSFNGPVYLPLVTLIDRLGFDDRIRELWTLVKDPMGLEPVSPLVYSALYPAFLARILLAVLLVAGVLWIVRRPSRFSTTVADSLGLLLILSPTVHPWYWLPVSIVALVARRQVWLFLASGSMLSYLLYDSAHPALVLAASYALPLIAWRLRANDIGAQASTNGGAG